MIAAVRLASALAAVSLASAAAPAHAGPYCAPGLSAGQPPIAPLNPRGRLDARQARILKFAPIVYLHPDEKYLPMRVEEFFAHKTTKVTKGGAVVIPAGKSTMAALYAQAQAGLKDRLTIQPEACAKAGSDPARISRGKVLTTPVYAVYLTRGGVDYIKYFFFYGFNGHYPLKVLGVKLKDNVGGDHWGDIERIMVQLDRTRTRIDRIFFASHGSTDSMFVPRAQLQLQGHRPIVYSALNGHGSYPRAGLWVRIGGFANDVTGRGRRWEPQVVQVFPRGPGFNPATMGWIYAPAELGPGGIGTLGEKGWFLDPNEKAALKPLENWCANPNDRICQLRKAGARAVWQPVLDEIQKTLGQKVVAPIRAQLEKARDVVKATGAKVTTQLKKAAANAEKVLTQAAKTAGKKLSGAGKTLGKALKKLKFW